MTYMVNVLYSVCLGFLLRSSSDLLITLRKLAHEIYRDFFFFQKKKNNFEFLNILLKTYTYIVSTH